MVQRSRFEELARPHMDAAYNTAFWIVRNRDDAEDAVQDAYLRAYRAFGGFQGDAMRPWLLAIVRNAALRVLQKRKSARGLLSLDSAIGLGGAETVLEVASPEPSAEAELIAAGERDRLRAALAELPDVYREIVVFRDLEGLSYAEIAEVLQIAPGTVMSRLSRGRAELRKVLTRCTGEGRRDGM